MTRNRTNERNAFIDAIANYDNPVKRNLESDWAYRLDLPTKLVVFSHLDENNNGVLPSGVVLSSNGTTVAYRRVADVENLHDLGEFLEDNLPHTRRHRKSAPLSFLEKSATAYHSVLSNAKLVGAEPDWTGLLPDLLLDIPGLSYTGTPEEKTLSFTTPEVPGFRINHIAGVLFRMSFDNTGMGGEFCDEESYRTLIRLAHSMGVIGEKSAKIIAPVPSEDLSRRLAEVLQFHPDLLDGLEWSGVHEYVLPLGKGYAVVTDHRMSAFHLARNGLNLLVITSADQLLGLTDFR